MSAPKIAVVTGTSSGIGKATAEQLLNHGWKVYGLSRSKSAIDNPNFIWIACDLADDNEIAAATRQIDEPTIDLLVSNAGIAFEELASAVTRRSYEEIYSVNVLAPMLLINCLRRKIEHAAIISVSSVSDRLVEEDFALYCSSKAANTRYFEAVAAEFTNAKVVTLLPDNVDTAMLRALVIGRDFDWAGTINASDMAQLIIDITAGKLAVDSGSNIIVVTNRMTEDLEYREKLFGFNTDTGELIEL